jgi:membrane protease subunit HflK
VLVDQKSGNSLLFLPLDKLIQSAGATADAAGRQAVEPAVPQAAPGEPAPPSVREGLRGRDREARP